MTELPEDDKSARDLYDRVETESDQGDRTRDEPGGDREDQTADLKVSRPYCWRAATPRTAAAIIRLSAAIDRPPSSVGGMVAKPIADAFG